MSSSSEESPSSSTMKKVGNAVVKGGVKGLLHTQFGRFILVGGLNTLVDLLVLNLLIVSFNSGPQDSLTVAFKGIAFLVAMANSYVLNKLWTFGAKEGKAKSELLPFIIVSFVGFLLNVGAFKLFMSWTAPPVELVAFLWPSVGALVGTAAGLGWNFVGYKTIVFRKPAADKALADPDAQAPETAPSEASI